MSPTTTLFGGRVSARLTTGRGVSGTSAPIVVVGATIVIGVIVRSIGVGVVVATSWGVVVVSLAVSSRSGHGDSFSAKMKRMKDENISVKTEKIRSTKIQEEDISSCATVRDERYVPRKAD